MKLKLQLIKLLLAVFLVCTISSGNSQTPSQYHLSISNGVYTPLSLAGGATAIPAVVADDANFNITGLPPFTFAGAAYTNIQVNSNGRLCFYTGTAPTTTGNYTPISTAITNAAGVIAPFGADLQNQAGTQFFTQQIGDELIFDWQNYRRWNVVGDALNFQVRLHLITGAIQFVYGPTTVGASTTNPQVGFRTNTTFPANVNNLMLDVIGSPASCNWSNAVTAFAVTSSMYFNNANPTVSPFSGLTYTWLPQADVARVNAFSAVSSITSSGATLNWTAPTGATEYNVQYREVGSCNWTNWSGNPVSSNSVTLSGLNPVTSYQVRVQSSNGVNSPIFSQIPNNSGAANGYAATGTFTTLPLSCTGTPALANTISSASQVCPTTNFTLSLSTVYTETGITYQWQSADDAAFTVNLASLGTAATQATSQSTTKWYRCVVTCTNTGDFITSVPVEVVMNINVCNPAPYYPLSTTIGTYSSIAATGTPVSIVGDDISVNITGLSQGIIINGVNYVNARMNSNGWLALYSGAAPTSNTSYTPLSAAMTGGNVIIAPFGVDLINTTGTAAYRQTIGNEHIFEWVNYARFDGTTSSATAGEFLNFQVRLNFMTGEIKFAYGNMISGTNTAYPQIGWKTNGQIAANWATDVNNMLLDVVGSPNTCTWENTVTGNANNSTTYFNAANAGVFPSNGHTFTWTPQASPAPVRVFLAVSGIAADEATINFTAPVGATQYNVRYRALGSCSWINATGNPYSSTSITINGLNGGTTYQVQVQSSDGTNNGLWSHIPNQAGTASGYNATGTFTTLQLPCSGNPAAASAQSSAPDVCSGVSFTLSVNTSYTESGITYQWQSSSDGINYADIPSANAASLITSQSSDTWYQLIITCTNSGLTTTSSPVQVLMSPYFNCYCTPTYTFGKTDGDLISRVQISGTTLDNNTGAAQVNPAYTYFPPNPPVNSQTAELAAGTSYTVNISVGTWGNQHVRVWIDYNQDGIFDNSESVGSTVVALGQGNTGPFAPAAFNISLACNPPVGTYRMRVRSVWNTTPNFHLTLDPCATYGYGETEDYDITILPPPPCPAPSAISAVPVSTSADISWVPGCSETEWNVEYGPTGFVLGTGTPINGITSIPLTISGLDPNTTYDVYVLADCDANGLSSPTGPMSFTTLPENDLCANATPLLLSCNTTTSVSGNTSAATNTGNGPTCGTTASTAPGLWYSFEGTGGVIEASLCGSTFDTKLFIYQGSCSALTCVAGNDDFCGTASQVVFSTTAATTYYVLVTGFGTESGAFDLSLTPLAFSASVSATEINCFGETSTVTVTGVGGVGPYSGAGTFNETAGTYNYLIEDAWGCQATANVTITEPSLLEIDVASTDILCNGDLSTITVSATGGTAPYNGVGTYNEPAGTYNYIVTDDKGCTASDMMTINQPDAIVLTETVIDVTCFGLSNGSIDAVISGGVGPYLIGWSNGESTESITGLMADDYDFTITDDNGCVATGTITVNQPNQLSVNFDVTNNDCFGSASGSIDIEVTGGNAPYTYEWSNGETIEDISGLSAGNYEVRIIDANGCVLVDDTDVLEGDEIIISPILILDATSCVNNDGEIQINITGGNGVYTFDWDNGDNTQDIFNLAPGIYTLVVTDALGCIGSFITAVGQPAAPDIVLISSDDPLCFGDANGSIFIDVTGGNAPYNFDWSNSETSQNISGLTEGSYTVLVTDGLGCENVLTVDLLNPDPISITGISLDLTCHNSANGEVDIIVSGGTVAGNYTFDWSDGGTFSANSQNLSGLSSGLYTVIVTDDNGCTSTSDFSVNAPSPISVSEVITDETLGNDGEIDLTVSGGTAPYSFDWSNFQTSEDLSGLTAGVYSVTITDDNGCTENFDFVVGSSVNLSDINKFNVQVFPNPSNGLFFVEISDANTTITSMVVRDALGRTVEQLSPNGNRFSFNLINVENGTYFLEMISGEQRIIKTILIQN